jgi:hypothetical protein
MEQNAFLGNLARLVDDGRLAGNADIASLNETFPALLTIDEWLAGSGGPALQVAIDGPKSDVSLR